MFGYRSNVPKVRLTTDRLVVRLVHDRDAWRLADYYAENRHFLKPWEPVRDESHCCQFFQCCSWLFSCLLSRLFDWAKMAGQRTHV